MAFQLRAAAAAFYCMASASMAQAADMCPAPPAHSHPPADAFRLDDHLIHIDSDDATVEADGHAVLNGHVKVLQEGRSVSADSMVYDYKTGRLAVKGSVDFEDPKLRIDSDRGTYDALGGADFNQANFQILDRRGRGIARELKVNPDGRVQLERVRYTTCPVGNEDWMLQASSIDLDTAHQEGVGRGVVMRFKDVPIFYTPYISFPIGDERKSGVLYPSFGHSGSIGYQLQVPYYFNMAPNYDLTLTPGFLSARGVQLGGEFRYLTAASRGQVEASFLPDDRIERSNRSYFHVTDTTDLEPGLRFDADVAAASDSNYFSDFAVGSEQTSVTYLERRAEVLYFDDAWRIRGELQNFQTIDISLPAHERPYSRAPRLQAQGLWPMLDGHVELAFDGEATYFLKQRAITTDDPNGARVDLSPELRWSTRTPGYFFEPAVGYHFTQYDLQDAPSGYASQPSRELPYARLDAGLVFERNAGSAGQRTQTLEPRMVYSYVPYRNQDRLWNFDTALPDLNLTELFRTNRYVGGDRIGDANQLAVGVTTRLFDQVSGAQYLSATLGQIRYFSIPRVTLPIDPYLATTGQLLPVPAAVNPLALPGQNLIAASQYVPVVPGTLGQGGGFPASDLVAQVDLTGYKHASVDLGYLWNPYTRKTDKSEISVQYHPEPAKVVNLGYSFQEGILRQMDGSFAWPVANNWNTVGRYVYSMQDHQAIEQVAGFEYKSCCWRIQIVQRRYLRRAAGTLNGTLDTSIALQLELTGLSSVGKTANSYLEKEIRGYTARDPQNPGVP